MLRRGFKSEANDLAREVRTELGLLPADPLDPFGLAVCLDILVFPITLLTSSAPEAVAYLTVQNPSVFSAVTVFDGMQKTIWHNDVHAFVRQRANVAHEIAHALLMHMPTVTRDPLRARPWDAAAEEEAQWLGPALLVSEEAAIFTVRSGMDLVSSAAYYQVSTDLMSFRLGVTGAMRRVSRIRAARPRRVKIATRKSQ